MLYIIFLISLKALLLNNVKSNTIIDEAVNITSKYYKHQFVTSVVWSDNDSGVDGFLKKFPGCVVVTSQSEDENVIQATKERVGYAQTVFFGSKPSAFERFMAITSLNSRFPIRLVLILENSLQERIQLSKFFKISWQYNLIDIVIISYDDKKEITLSTYFPFSDGICDNHSPVTLNSSDNLFPKKFRNFNKCPLRTNVMSVLPLVSLNVLYDTIIGLGGYDGITLSLIANKLNASLVLKRASSRDVFGTYTNGTADGVFKDLMENEADILLPAALLTFKRYSVSQVSSVIRTMDVRWIGPKRRPIYTWIRLLLPFFTIVTPILCLTFIIFVTVVTLITRYRRTSRKIRGFNIICFQTFTLFLGLTVNCFSNMRLLNFLFILWIWFCFIIRIDYQGDLFKYLQNEMLESPFTSIEEAVSKVNWYGGSEVFLDFYRNTSLEKGYTIVPLSHFNSNLERITRGERFLIATNTLLVQHIRTRLQILDVQITSAPTCLYMRPGWPAAGTFNSYVIRLVETGYITKILNSDKDERSLNKENSDTTRPIDISMLSACFYGLVVMSVICFVIFVIEVTYHKYMTPNIRHKEDFNRQNNFKVFYSN